MWSILYKNVCKKHGPRKARGSGAWATCLVDGAPAIPFTNRGRIWNTTVNLSLPLFEQNALTLLAYILVVWSDIDYIRRFASIHIAFRNDYRLVTLSFDIGFTLLKTYLIIKYIKITFNNKKAPKCWEILFIVSWCNPIFHHSLQIL